MKPTKLNTALAALACHAVALLAPFVVPIALLLTKEGDINMPKEFSWFDTPDEPMLFDMTMPTIQKFYEKWGWFLTAWVWFGFRNRAHGFKSDVFGREAPEHWPNKDLQDEIRQDGHFIIRKRYGRFVTVFGWQVYRSKKHKSGLEYRPMFTIKNRKIKEEDRV
jgi:hypothetical protein